MERSFRIVRCDFGIQWFENPTLIIACREDCLRNDAAGGERNAAAIIPINLEPSVQEPGNAPLDHGRTGGDGRHDRQQHPNGRMQPGKFAIVGERQIHMHGLQIGPAVSATIENTIERLVHDAVIVRPNHHLTVRIHPGMHRRGKQAGPIGSRIELMRRTLLLNSRGSGASEPAGSVVLSSIT